MSATATPTWEYLLWSMRDGIPKEYVIGDGTRVIAHVDRETDAQRIVTAVNAHEVLVAALRDSLAKLSAHDRMRHGDGGGPECGMEFPMLLDIVRAALKLAEGQG